MSYKNKFLDIQSNSQKFWKNNNTHKAKINPNKEKYYVLSMFPYPSGEGLHVGHTLGYVASDIVARYHRLLGYEVLHPMGFDAFGLPAEQFAIATGIHPSVITEKNTSRYLDQLNKLGLHIDPDRIIKTCDAQYYKWTQSVFIKLFEHYYDLKEDKAQPISKLQQYFLIHGTKNNNGYTHQTHKHYTNQQWKNLSQKQQHSILLCYRLAFLENSLVNWCEKLGCVLANDEVVNGKSVRGNHPVTEKMLYQWKLRISAYSKRLLQGLNDLNWSNSIKTIQKNWIGKSQGIEIDFKIDNTDNDYLKIFTTRADTIYGVTFMAISPYHRLIAKISHHQILATIEQIKHKITKDKSFYTKIEPSLGVYTGINVIHPLNGKIIPIWVADYVSQDYARGAIMAVPSDDQRDHIFAKKHRLDIIDNHTSKTILEGIDDIEKKIDLVFQLLTKDSNTTTQKKITYKLKDAVFARQRYWGEPIPIYYIDELPYALTDDKLPLNLPHLDNIQTKDNKPPLCQANNWHSEHNHRLETSTMPGFAGSCAYYIRFMDPNNNDHLVSTQALNYWKAVDLYIGGAEHATGHLIYSRFWNMFLYDIGMVFHKEPFIKMINQGMILGQSQYIHRISNSKPTTFVSFNLKDTYQTEKFPIDITLVKNNQLNIEGFKKWRSEYQNAEFICDKKHKFYCEPLIEKMSKSLYNTINPDDIIEEYGADTLRLYVMFLGPLTQVKPWSSSKIEGISRFLNKFHRLFYDDKDDNENLIVEDKELSEQELIIINKAIDQVKKDTAIYQFNTAISALMIATNQLLKLKSHKLKALEPMVMLIASYCPHLAEHLFNKLNKKFYPKKYNEKKSIFDLGYFPKVDQKYLQSNTWTAPVAINGKVKFTTELDNSLDDDQIKKTIIANDLFIKFCKDREIKKWIIVKAKMINILL